jgi:hypothetical protein
MTPDDMKTIALNTLDIQAKESLPDMLLLIKRIGRHKITPVEFNDEQLR